MSIPPREIIAYQGPAFTIEWYYDEQGRSEVLEYVNRLSLDRQSKLIALIRLMGDVGKIFDQTKFRHEGEQIYVFKPQPDRFLCFFVRERKIIITNAFEKKTDKLPTREKEKALRRRASYRQRTQEKTYYENL